jgi:tetratricopeptide (TPR) repeat protein
VERFPDNSQLEQVHYELGQAYEIQGQLDRALEHYKKISVKDAVLVVKAQLAIAGILSKELDPQRAITAYENIIVANPDFAGDAYVRLGQLYRNAQNYEKEIEVYQKALKAKDEKGVINKAQLQFNLADTLELMSHTEEAIEQYFKIPHLYPQEIAWVVKAYLRVAKIYEEGKDWEGANVIYQKIIQLNAEESKYAQERLDWIKNSAVTKK